MKWAALDTTTRVNTMFQWILASFLQAADNSDFEFSY